MLKPKSYLSRLEDIARLATYHNALFTTSPVLSKASENYFPTNFSLELPK